MKLATISQLMAGDIKYKIDIPDWSPKELFRTLKNNGRRRGTRKQKYLEIVNLIDSLPEEPEQPTFHGTDLDFWLLERLVEGKARSRKRYMHFSKSRLETIGIDEQAAVDIMSMIAALPVPKKKEKKEREAPQYIYIPPGHTQDILKEILLEEGEKGSQVRGNIVEFFVGDDVYHVDKNDLYEIKNKNVENIVAAIESRSAYEKHYRESGHKERYYSVKEQKQQQGMEFLRKKYQEDERRKLMEKCKARHERKKAKKNGGVCKYPRATRFLGR